ncbi:hypothetical protein [Magnetospirillum sulfuroxidans]|uniref:Uncharacterized protein n=1 Tax=Magnetospirillum sulfuroxidans TaxID=611300 RepID=A0ABS5IE74_9PROT|nr:hypothetical protein [Magnetospirillum sulfuroxidans]MBR9972571.1 hypothetical protein [Magnetospirillum sulfuroxidans]
MVAAFADSQAHTRPTDLIVEALKGEIAAIFRREIPALAKLDASVSVYETAMNDVEVLSSCFSLFRARPELFVTAIAGRDKQPVIEDTGLLSCGRSLGEAIALIVRAAARRHFRRKLGISKRVHESQIHKLPGWKRLLISVGLMEAPPVQVRTISGGGDALYSVIRDYLRFDWQANLIPHYTPLEPAMVVKLGPRIMDIREPAELRALASREERANMAGGGQPLLLDSAKRLIKPAGDTIDGEILWKVCTQMDLARLFPGRDSGHLRRILAQIAGTSTEAIIALMPVLGEDIRLFVTFLYVAYAELGEEEYRQSFGGGATVWMVRRYADRLAQLGALPPPAFAQMRDVFAAVIKGGAGK